LFPKDVKLPKTERETISCFGSTKDEYIASIYPLEKLKIIQNISKDITNANKCDDFIFRDFVLEYKKLYKTQKMNDINKVLNDAINNYSLFETNYDVTKLARIKRQKQYSELMKQYAIKVK